MKYIDAEKLKSLIRERYNTYKIGQHSPFRNGKVETLREAIELIDSLQHEQPEVDLDKFTDKVDAFKARYKHPESISVKGAMTFMARMFYQYPNVARQWYEQLPKATMD